MPTAVVVLADGFEEIEAITPIDFLRRAGIVVSVAGLNGLQVTSARGLVVQCDLSLADVEKDWQMLVLPGGQPGAKNLSESVMVKEALAEAFRRGAWVAAICASPMVVLGSAGFLEGRRYTGYPGTKGDVRSALYLEQAVVVDGTLITSRGVGTAAEFALMLVEVLAGAERSLEVARAVLLA